MAKNNMSQLLNKLNKKSLSLVKEIGQLASDLGLRAYIVGGPVRDLLLGVLNEDIDITVEGKGILLAEAFAKKHSASKITRYQAFKTATVFLSDKLIIDFATARKETYSKGGAFPKVIASNIKDDLFRRDFTINAIAIEINPEHWGKIVDPFKGVADIKGRKIRILHDKSFEDDPTRILRAARFKTRFDFAIDRKTLGLLKKGVADGVLDTIKPQRYKKEFDKILKEKKSKEAVECLQTWNAYKRS